MTDRLRPLGAWGQEADPYREAEHEDDKRQGFNERLAIIQVPANAGRDADWDALEGRHAEQKKAQAIEDDRPPQAFIRHVTPRPQIWLTTILWHFSARFTR